MAQPRIGIATYGRDENKKFYLPAKYVDAIRRAGRLPFLLHPGEPCWQEGLRHIDGLLLTGGGDIDPAIYSGIQHEKIYMVVPTENLILPFKSCG